MTFLPVFKRHTNLWLFSPVFKRHTNLWLFYQFSNDILTYDFFYQFSNDILTYDFFHQFSNAWSIWHSLYTLSTSTDHWNTIQWFWAMTSKWKWKANNILIQWISETWGLLMSSNPLCPCVRKPSVLRLPQVSLYPPLSPRTSWINTGLTRCRSATLSDPSPSVCLPLASPRVLPLSEPLRSLWNISTTLIGGGLLVSPAPPTALRRPHGPLFGAPSLINVHAPMGSVVKPLKWPLRCNWVQSVVTLWSRFWPASTSTPSGPPVPLLATYREQWVAGVVPCACVSLFPSTSRFLLMAFNFVWLSSLLPWTRGQPPN